MKEHVNIEHLDRRIRCGCGQEFKWRSAFARHKAKCLLAQYSVTDPNPQKRTSRANRKSDLSQPSKPNPEISQKNATNDSLGRPDTSSTNTTVVTMESQPQFSKLPMMTTNVTTQSAVNTKFIPNSGTSAEAAVMIRKYTDLSTTKDKHASTITTTNQQIQSSTFGVNQHQANSRSLTKSIDTCGSVNFVISETPSSAIRLQLMAGTNIQNITRELHHQGYVSAPLPASQASPILHQSTSAVSQGTTNVVVTSMSKIENRAIGQHFTSNQNTAHFTVESGVSNTEMIETDPERE